MRSAIRKFIEEWSKDKRFDEAFLAGPGANPLPEYSPEYRTELLLRFAGGASDRAMMDCEHGISGYIVHGSAEVWNKEEFGPWDIDQSTVVLGNLTVDGTIRLSRGAALFVAKNFRLDNLIVLDGEVHCAGKIVAKHRLIGSDRSYLHASQIETEKIGFFGVMQCAHTAFTEKFANQESAFRNTDRLK